MFFRTKDEPLPIQNTLFPAPLIVCPLPSIVITICLFKVIVRVASYTPPSDRVIVASVVASSIASPRADHESTLVSFLMLLFVSFSIVLVIVAPLVELVSFWISVTFSSFIVFYQKYMSYEEHK